MKTTEQHTKSIRKWLVSFIVLLLISGLTAFPVESELQIILSNIPSGTFPFLEKIYEGVKTTNSEFPFMAYGTDWLAFSHIVIAIAFIGPLRDPVQNIWVLQFGMIACLIVFPLAFICGPIRGIPFYWQLIDCSFGVFGFIPLWICYRKTLKIKYLLTHQSKNEN